MGGNRSYYYIALAVGALLIALAVYLFSSKKSEVAPEMKGGSGGSGSTIFLNGGETSTVNNITNETSNSAGLPNQISLTQNNLSTTEINKTSKVSYGTSSSNVIINETVNNNLTKRSGDVLGFAPDSVGDARSIPPLDLAGFSSGNYNSRAQKSKATQGKACLFIMETINSEAKKINPMKEGEKLTYLLDRLRHIPNFGAISSSNQKYILDGISRDLKSKGKADALYYCDLIEKLSENNPVFQQCLRILDGIITGKIMNPKEIDTLLNEMTSWKMLEEKDKNEIIQMIITGLKEGNLSKEKVCSLIVSKFLQVWGNTALFQKCLLVMQKLSGMPKLNYALVDEALQEIPGYKFLLKKWKDEIVEGILQDPKLPDGQLDAETHCLKIVDYIQKYLEGNAIYQQCMKVMDALYRSRIATDATSIMQLLKNEIPGFLILPSEMQEKAVSSIVTARNDGSLKEEKVRAEICRNLALAILEAMGGHVLYQKCKETINSILDSGSGKDKGYIMKEMRENMPFFSQMPADKQAYYVDLISKVNILEERDFQVSEICIKLVGDLAGLVAGSQLFQQCIVIMDEIIKDNITQREEIKNRIEKLTGFLLIKPKDLQGKYIDDILNAMNGNTLEKEKEAICISIVSSIMGSLNGNDIYKKCISIIQGIVDSGRFNDRKYIFDELMKIPGFEQIPPENQAKYVDYVSALAPNTAKKELASQEIFIDALKRLIRGKRASDITEEQIINALKRLSGFDYFPPSALKRYAAKIQEFYLDVPTLGQDLASNEVGPRSRSALIQGAPQLRNAMPATRSAQVTQADIDKLQSEFDVIDKEYKLADAEIKRISSHYSAVSINHNKMQTNMNAKLAAYNKAVDEKAPAATITNLNNIYLAALAEYKEHNKVFFDALTAHYTMGTLGVKLSQIGSQRAKKADELRIAKSAFTLQSQLMTLESDKNNLQSQVTALQGQVTQAQSQLSAASADKVSLQAQITGFQGQINTLNNQLNNINGQNAGALAAAIEQSEKDKQVAILQAQKDKNEALLQAEKDKQAALAQAEKDKQSALLIAAAIAEKDKQMALLQADKDKQSALAQAEKDKLQALALAYQENQNALVQANINNQNALAQAEKDKQVALAQAEKDNAQALLNAQIEKDKLQAIYQASLASLQEQNAQIISNAQKDAALSRVSNFERRAVSLYRDIKTDFGGTTSGTLSIEEICMMIASEIEGLGPDNAFKQCVRVIQGILASNKNSYDAIKVELLRLKVFKAMDAAAQDRYIKSIMALQEGENADAQIAQICGEMEKEAEYMESLGACTKEIVLVVNERKQTDKEYVRGRMSKIDEFKRLKVEGQDISLSSIAGLLSISKGEGGKYKETEYRNLIRQAMKICQEMMQSQEIESENIGGGGTSNYVRPIIPEKVPTVPDRIEFDKGKCSVLTAKIADAYKAYTQTLRTFDTLLAADSIISINESLPDGEYYIPAEYTHVIEAGLAQDFISMLDKEPENVKFVNIARSLYDNFSARQSPLNLVSNTAKVTFISRLYRDMEFLMKYQFVDERFNDYILEIARCTSRVKDIDDWRIASRKMQDEMMGKRQSLQGMTQNIMRGDENIIPGPADIVFSSPEFRSCNTQLTAFTTGIHSGKYLNSANSKKAMSDLSVAVSKIAGINMMPQDDRDLVDTITPAIISQCQLNSPKCNASKENICSQIASKIILNRPFKLKNPVPQPKIATDIQSPTINKKLTSSVQYSACIKQALSSIRSNERDSFAAHNFVLEMPGYKAIDSTWKQNYIEKGNDLIISCKGNENDPKCLAARDELCRGMAFASITKQEESRSDVSFDLLSRCSVPMPTDAAANEKEILNLGIDSQKQVVRSGWNLMQAFQISAKEKRRQIVEGIWNATGLNGGNQVPVSVCQELQYDIWGTYNADNLKDVLVDPLEDLMQDLNDILLEIENGDLMKDFTLPPSAKCKCHLEKIYQKLHNAKIGNYAVCASSAQGQENMAVVKINSSQYIASRGAAIAALSIDPSNNPTKSMCNMIFQTLLNIASDTGELRKFSSSDDTGLNQITMRQICIQQLRDIYQNVVTYKQEYFTQSDVFSDSCTNYPDN